MKKSFQFLFLSASLLLLQACASGPVNRAPCDDRPVYSHNQQGNACEPVDNDVRGKHY